MIGSSGQHFFVIRPKHFGYHAEAARSNTFASDAPVPGGAAAAALREFDEHFLPGLRAAGLSPVVFDDLDDVVCPDAVFPNNWLVCAPWVGALFLMPMCDQRRRSERRSDIVDELMRRFPTFVRVADRTAPERDGRALEGTGSVVFDHSARTVFACRSARTDGELFWAFCQEIGYKGVLFAAKGRNGVEVYHTNVLMSIGSGYALCAMEMIDEKDRQRVRERLEESGKKVVEIREDQVENFAGNALELRAEGRERPWLAMSARAMRALEEAQLRAVREFADPLPLEVDCIERVGGGSVRCMICEIC